MMALALFLSFFPFLGGPPGPLGPGPPKDGNMRETMPMPSYGHQKINCILSKQNFGLVLAGAPLLHILIDNDKRNIARFLEPT